MPASHCAEQRSGEPAGDHLKPRLVPMELCRGLRRNPPASRDAASDRAHPGRSTIVSCPAASTGEGKRSPASPLRASSCSLGGRSMGGSPKPSRCYFTRRSSSASPSRSRLAYARRRRGDARRRRLPRRWSTIAGVMSIWRVHCRPPKLKRCLRGDAPTPSAAARRWRNAGVARHRSPPEMATDQRRSAAVL